MKVNPVRVPLSRRLNVFMCFSGRVILLMCLAMIFFKRLSVWGAVLMMLWVYYILGKRPRSEGSSDSSISFCDDDLEGVDLPHNDPLVISLKVGDHSVNKILVDTGSSVNVMYNNLFKMLKLKLEDLKPTSCVMRGFNGVLVEPMGEVTLPIYVDPVTIQTLFLVVNVSSQYNTIIGRRWLHEMRAVPSSFTSIQG